MLERPARGPFGGLWVFPGGALEPTDRGPLAENAVTIPHGAEDLPWRAAALRETAEEVGIAVTRPQLGQPIDALGEAVFEEVLERGAVLDGERLDLLSRWVTPQGFPVRFDARFYLAVVDTAPPPLARDAEVADVKWVSPGEGLERAEEGTWLMVTPTIHHLRWLAGHAGVDAIDAAAKGADVRRPEPLTETDGSRVPVPLPPLLRPL